MSPGFCVRGGGEGGTDKFDWAFDSAQYLFISNSITRLAPMTMEILAGNPIIRKYETTESNHEIKIKLFSLVSFLRTFAGKSSCHCQKISEAFNPGYPSRGPAYIAVHNVHRMFRLDF